MGTPAQGTQSYLQLGVESTYGTAAAATHRYEIISEGLEPNIGVINDPSLHGVPVIRKIYRGGVFYAGRISLRCNYTGIIPLFKMMYGSFNAVPVGGVKDVFFKEPGTLPSYTLEIIKGGIPTSKCWKFVGTMGVGYTFSVEAGQSESAMGRFDLDFIAKDVTLNATPTAALTATSALPILFHHATSATTDGITAGADFYCQRLEISLRNDLPTNRFALGDATIKQPFRQGLTTGTWMFRSEYQSEALIGATKADTELKPTCLFRGDETSPGSGYYHELAFSSEAAHITNWSAPINGPGIIQQEVTMSAVYDVTSAAGLIARIRTVTGDI